MSERIADLDVLAHNLKTWRKDKESHGTKLPVVLNDEILRLCRLHGARRVCEHVGLTNFGRWQKRVDDEQKRDRPPKRKIVSANKSLSDLASKLIVNECEKLAKNCSRVASSTAAA